MPWAALECDDFKKRLKKFSKVNAWTQELQNIVDNLDTLLDSLKQGIKPAQLRNHNFVHAKYELGILSIDQSGPRGKHRPKPLRLYVYPFEPRQKLYLMTLEEKSTQSEDVKLCKVFVRGLLE